MDGARSTARDGFHGGPGKTYPYPLPCPKHRTGGLSPRGKRPEGNRPTYQCNTPVII